MVAPLAETKTQERTEDRWTVVGIGAVILLAVVAAYANGLHGEFVFDDAYWISGNASINDVFPLSRHVAGGNPRPMLNFTLALSRAMGGEDPFAFHLFNLAVHVLAAWALFAVVRRTLQRPVVPAAFSGRATWLAGATALLWATHPLATESVTYIVHRSESMMGLFLLLTLYCCIRAFTLTENSPRVWPGAAAWYAGAAVACVLGMASKEIMVVAPVLVLVYDRVFFSASFADALRRRWGLYVALGAAWGILIGLWAASPGRGSSIGLSTPVTPVHYALTQPEVILYYLRLAFWPDPLCVDYRWTAADTAGRIVPGLIVVGALLAATVYGLARGKAWAVLGAWFFLILAPTSSIVPLADLAAERRMYLPLAAVVTAAVLGVAWLGGAALERLFATEAERRRTAALLGAALTLAAACGLGYLTARRNETYRTALSLWHEVLRVRPENGRAWYNAGVLLGKAGRKAEAVAYYSRAVEVAPDTEVHAWYNRGELLASAGHWPEALADYDRVVALDPGYARGWVNRGAALLALGRYAEAVSSMDRALALDATAAEAWCDRGVARAALGAHREALADFTRALEVRADFHDALVNRAVTHMALKDYDRAWADVRQLRAMGVEAGAVVKALEQASGRKQ